MVQKPGTEVTVRSEAGEEFRGILCSQKSTTSKIVCQDQTEKKTVHQRKLNREKSCPANHDKSVWKQPSASSEFAVMINNRTEA